jgi:hypothetical protein
MSLQKIIHQGGEAFLKSNLLNSFPLYLEFTELEPSSDIITKFKFFEKNLNKWIKNVLAPEQGTKFLEEITDFTDYCREMRSKQFKKLMNGREYLNHNFSALNQILKEIIPFITRAGAHQYLA